MRSVMWVKESDYQAQEARRGEESTEAQSRFLFMVKRSLLRPHHTTGGMVKFYCRESCRVTATVKRSQRSNLNPVTPSIDQDSGKQYHHHDNKGGQRRASSCNTLIEEYDTVLCGRGRIEALN